MLFRKTTIATVALLTASAMPLPPVSATTHPASPNETCHITITGFDATSCMANQDRLETLGFHNTHAADLRVVVTGPSGTFDECVEGQTYSNVDHNFHAPDAPIPGLYKFYNNGPHTIQVYAGCVECPCPPVFSMDFEVKPPT